MVSPFLYLAWNRSRAPTDVRQCDQIRRAYAACLGSSGPRFGHCAALNPRALRSKRQ